MATYALGWRMAGPTDGRIIDRECLMLDLGGGQAGAPSTQKAPPPPLESWIFLKVVSVAMVGLINCLPSYHMRPI